MYNVPGRILVQREHWAGKNCWPISWRKLMLLWQAQCRQEGEKRHRKNGMPQTDTTRRRRRDSPLSAVPFSAARFDEQRGGLGRSPARNPRNIEHARSAGYAARCGTGPDNRYQLFCSARALFRTWRPRHCAITWLLQTGTHLAIGVGVGVIPDLQRSTKHCIPEAALLAGAKHCGGDKGTR